MKILTVQKSCLYEYLITGPWYLKKNVFELGFIEGYTLRITTY